jgi:hypothetical protein
MSKAIFKKSFQWKREQGKNLRKARMPGRVAKADKPEKQSEEIRMKLPLDWIKSAIKTLCYRNKTFTSDDLRKMAEKKGLTDIHKNAWGGMMSVLYRDGFIKPVKLSRSEIESNHGRRVVVWRLR